MSASTVSELLHALEQTIRDRFQVVNEVLRGRPQGLPVGLPVGLPQANVTQGFPYGLQTPGPNLEALISRISSLESRLQTQDAQISELRNLLRSPPELLPKNPIDGLEVIHHVQAPAITTESEVKVFIVKEAPEEPELEEEEEEAEVEEEEEEEAEETEELELTAFEYKGITYYRDADNNVYADEDGEVSDEPFGVWNEARQRILARK